MFFVNDWENDTGILLGNIKPLEFIGKYFWNNFRKAKNKVCLVFQRTWTIGLPEALLRCVCCKQIKNFRDRE